MLLSLIPPDANPETMELNTMTIVVRLTNIPAGHRNPSVARRLCANLGEVVEVIPTSKAGPQAFMRVRVRLNILEPFLRGVHLRLGNGMRQWIAFSYERMPVYCYLCGLVGHLEKKCTLRFGEGFVDPGISFPYGEWLKAPSPGSRFSEARSSGTAVSLPGRLERDDTIRGAAIFGVSQHGDGEGSSGSSGRGKENSGKSLPLTHNSLIVKPQAFKGAPNDRTAERSAVKISITKNRKKKATELGVSEDGRPAKPQVLGELSELISIPVVAAQQPHRVL